MGEKTWLENIYLGNNTVKEMTYQIRKTYLDDKISKISQEFGENSSDAFRRMCYSFLFRKDIDDIEEEDITEGSQEKQIDIIRIEQDEEESVTINIIQCTTEQGFSSDKLIKLKNGLKWVFQTPYERYSEIENTKLVSKIREIREIQDKVGMSNINLKVYFISLGNEESLSEEFKQEAKEIEDYDKVGYLSFELNIWGANKLVAYINDSESSEKVLNQKIAIIHDVNRGSLIHTTIGDYKGVICTVKGKEIARIIKEDVQKVIFNKNIRKYLGEKKKINSSIYDSCTKQTESKMFWFLNNGITIVCDYMEVNPDPDNPHIKLKNLQIVNGCQTSMSLFRASEKNELIDDVSVLVRIYSTSIENQSFIDKITLTTNNQNKIGLRDLKSNDIVQSDLQKLLLDKYGYYYEKKVNEYKDVKIDINKKVNNEKLAQAFMALGRKRPSIARSKPNYIWGDERDYDSIFRKSTPSQLLFSYKIYEYCNSKKKVLIDAYKADDNLYSTITYGLFHIVRVLGLLHLKNEAFPTDLVLDEEIKKIEQNPSILDEDYDKTIKILNNILEDNKDKFTSPNNFYKTNEIQTIINRKLKKIILEG